LSFYVPIDIVLQMPTHLSRPDFVYRCAEGDKNSKLVMRLLCWTDQIPLEHKSHTCTACLHSKKRCWHDSSLIWQRAHSVVFTVTPLLLKHSLVGTLPKSTLHAVINTLGKALIFQRQPKGEICVPLSGFSRHLYADFTVKLPNSSPLHTCLSCSSFVTVTLE